MRDSSRIVHVAMAVASAVLVAGLVVAFAAAREGSERQVEGGARVIVPLVAKDSSSGLPDLVPLGIGITTEPGSGCAGYNMLGFILRVANQGDAASGPFIARVGIHTVQFESIPPGQEASGWAGDYSTGEARALVDPDNEVAESDESNNAFVTFPPIPTPVPTCTPTP